MTSQRSTLRLLRVLLLSAVMLVAFASPSAASVSTLYAATGSGCSLSDLYTFDPSNGAVLTGPTPITIGGQQAQSVTGLAIDPTTGTLYGFMNDNVVGDGVCPARGNGTLLTINRTTGVATTVGSLGLAQIQSPDMSFDPFGNLYAWAENDSSGGVDTLYSLNKSTGTSTRIGPLCDDCPTYQTGLGIDSKGRMYLKWGNDVDGTLQRVNQFNGAVFNDVDLDSVNTHNMLAFGPGDVLYTGSRGGSGFTLRTLNPTTGAFTTVGSNSVFNVTALAWDSTSFTPPDQADLFLAKAVDDPEPSVGDPVTFTLTVLNGGPDDATGVKVKDLLGPGFTYVSDTPSQGTYDEATGIWNVGSITDSGNATLQITATVAAASNHINEAEIVDAATFDPNSVFGSGEGDTHAALALPPALYAATGANGFGNDGNCGGTPSSLYAVDPTTGDATLIGPIMIGATQARHVTGLGVDPTDGSLYAYMNGQDTSSSCLDFGQGTLLSINELTGGASTISTLGGVPIESPDISFDPFGELYAWNRSNPTGSEANDLWALDKSTGASSKVGECGSCSGGAVGLAVDSTGRMYVKPGSTLYRLNQFTGHRFSPVNLNVFSQNILAFGPSDVLYAGERQSSGLSLQTINPSTGNVTVVGSNDVDNVSAIAWDLGTTTPPLLTDISLDKDVINGSPSNWGENVIFTISVGIDSGNDATNVLVKDLLPAGFTYVSDNSGGDYDETTGIWDVGDLFYGAPDSIAITASVNPAGSYLNKAEVVDSTEFDGDSVPGSGEGDTFDSLTVTPTANPAVDAAAEVSVSGPSKTTATSKGFSVTIRNVGSQTFSVNQANLDVALNGNGSAASCKSFSSTVKPGRKVTAHCSANIATLGLTRPAPVTYEATVDVPADGFTINDSDDSGPRATS
jgi:uncharacterized repeat protein (TIGR01451 family)